MRSSTSRLWKTARAIRVSSTGAPEGMMISATAKPEVQEAAIKFMEFVISKEGGHRMIAECGEISCVKGAWDETN